MVTQKRTRLQKLRENKTKPLDAEPVTLFGLLAGLCLFGYGYFKDGSVDPEEIQAVLPVVAGFLASKFSFSKATVAELKQQVLDSWGRDPE